MFRLPFLFIATGIISFACFQIGTIADFGTWMSLQPDNPTDMSRIHLLVLGWATMIAMGAVYQLINVVLQSNLYSQKLGFVQYGFFAVGIGGLIYGFQSEQISWIAAFATLAFIGILLFVWNIMATLFRAAQLNTITISVGCAVVYLLTTAIFGMTMGLDFRFDFMGDVHDLMLRSHIWLGAVGWLGLLITGISYKLLPMFYLSHGFSTSLQKTTLILWNAGVLAGSILLLCGGPLWPGFLLIDLAIIAYNLHISQIYKHRHKPKPGAGIVWVVGLSRMLMVTSITLWFVFILFPQLPHHFILILGWSYLWGWVALTVLAYLSKIAPFLWWTHKYGPRVGKVKTPTMADLIPDRFIHLGLSLISVSLLILLTGLSVNQNMLISIGGTALAFASLAYISLIALVFTK
ncbi:MAG: hypothetical protein A2189_06490 [Paenibacillus sp. RIFOXYA1_FULL_44_5]|nr:MAG: hypothetical protein A2189_06490 [Paenibacillus sp. RIFOXYA1_FULL_44_5]